MLDEVNTARDGEPGQMFAATPSAFGMPTVGART